MIENLHRLMIPAVMAVALVCSCTEKAPVEEVPEAETRTEVHHRVNTINEGEVRVVTSVQTGDTAKLMLWSALALGCGIVLLFAGIYTWKRNREKGE